jgi:hypothetical protein
MTQPRGSHLGLLPVCMRLPSLDSWDLLSFFAACSEARTQQSVSKRLQLRQEAPGGTHRAASGRF